jgi:ATP-dependent helicase/nuclease subunit B
MNAGIATIPLAGNTLPAAVADALLAHHAAALPDLSALTVLVPNHRAGQDMARLLAQHSGLAALIPPHITPLRSWAPSAFAAEPQARRLARLHGVLRRESWLGTVDRWALARELLSLADELSGARIGAEIGARLRAQHHDLLDSETRLVEAVWRTLNHDDSNPQACYARQLDALLDAATSPLYGYALGPLTALEQHFLERYSARATVQLFSLDAHASPQVETLHLAWCEHEPPLKTRAAALSARYPESPLSEALTLYAAPHLEACARAVAHWVGAQLQQGRRSIALIALDRETARRTRALLERLDVLVADETGWTLSTTAAAAVIARWLDCIARDFPHSELLDLMKSPFVFDADDARQDAVLALELALRKHGVAQGMTPIRRLAHDHAADALPWLDRLHGSAQRFTRTRAPLAAWLERLHTSLAAIGALVPLAADPAGARVLDALAQAARELADDREPYSLAEWRRWLDMTLENESFTDTGIDSPVVLTSLPAARGRVFEAVAIIGADAQHLPARAAVGLFSQTTRTQLGLPTAADARAQTVDDLQHLLSQGPALISWQARNDDEPRPASPLILQLQALHRAAWHYALRTSPLAEAPATASVQPLPAARPAPVVAPAQLPRRYSPSTYQTLLDCPYRFFARSVLGLAALDEADDALDKSDYGNALHRILKHFHDSDPPTDAASALAQLQTVSDAEFNAAPPYHALAWRTQWAAIAPAYIDAWLAQSEAGWVYRSGETAFEHTLAAPPLGDIQLGGRVDRIDTYGDALQVIDYKTSSAARLKKQRDAPAEHIQLPFYAWLCDAAALYLPINDAPVVPLALDGECDVEAITLRLRDVVTAVARGAGLPANGVDTVCARCEARGLCRKGMWVV